MTFHGARVAVSGLLRGRTQALAESALNVVEVYAKDPADLEGVGMSMCAEVNRLGGLVRKVAQQASQLPDVVPAAALRQALQSLQGSNLARDKREIEQQLMRAFPGAEISVSRVCGTGCVGEVSEVLVLGDIDGLPSAPENVHVRYAAKTADPEQLRLFEQDFELFERLSDLMSIPLSCLRQINHKTAAELEAVVSKITDMARNVDLVRSVRNGFDMTVEMDNSRRAKEVLHRVGRGVFVAPEMYAASSNAYALMMELVEGEMLERHRTAEVPPEFVREFLGLYVRMLREGYLHQDLHPANILILPRSTGARRYALLDWGEVVEVPEVHQEDTYVLLRTVVAGRWMGAEHDSLQELFRRLGVLLKPNRDIQEDAYQALANMLNVVQALRGDTQENNTTLVKAASFQVPGWLEAWQKATNACAISLQAAGATPEIVADELQKALTQHP